MASVSAEAIFVFLYFRIFVFLQNTLIVVLLIAWPCVVEEFIPCSYQHLTDKLFQSPQIIFEKIYNPHKFFLRIPTNSPQKYRQVLMFDGNG